MRLHRFYVKESLAGKDEIKIFDEKMLHQLRDVFRLKVDDEVVLFTGDGVDHKYKITLLSKKEGVFEKVSEERTFIPEVKVTLLLSVIKKENFELACEKATEIGASVIVPIVTDRTLAKNLNFERLQKIVIEASEQCGRGDVPEVREAIRLEDAMMYYGDIVAFDITGEKFEESNPKSEISILIGPEGGWSDGELNLMREKNIAIAKLGNTTLRAETAAIVACAKVIL